MELGTGAWTDIRIIAPGVEHFVYTVQSSMCTGDHFYMMGLLTKSLEAMKCDRSQPGGIGTNERLMEEYDLSK